MIFDTTFVLNSVACAHKIGFKNTKNAFTSFFITSFHDFLFGTHVTIHKKKTKHATWLHLSERNPNFAIVNMKRENFFDIKEMEQLAVKMNEKENTIWQNTQSIIHTLDGPIILNVKRSGDSETSIVKAVLPDEFTDISLLTFDESSNEISKSKYDDLIKSLEFIPDQHHHEFYKALKHSTSFELDYGLASKLTDDENMSD